jgi:hypothetical protein
LLTSLKKYKKKNIKKYLKINHPNQKAKKKNLPSEIKNRYKKYVYILREIK